MVKEGLIKITIQSSNHEKQYCAVVAKQDGEVIDVGEPDQRLGSDESRVQRQASVVKVSSR